MRKNEFETLNGKHKALVLESKKRGITIITTDKGQRITFGKINLTKYEVSTKLAKMTNKMFYSDRDWQSLTKEDYKKMT